MSTLLLSLLLTAPCQGTKMQVPADVPPVITTQSGLKYCVLTKGQEGPSPKFGDKVKVHYTGWDTEGGVFDSSRHSPKPSEFAIGDVVEGWNEALMMMTVGARWKLVVPPEIGYGSAGNPPVIKPNATLIFELELISFEKGPDLPPFHPGDPARQQKNESGLVYEPVSPSRNADALPPKADDVLEVKYALWNTKGRLIDCTEKRAGFMFKGRAQDLPFRLLQIAPQYIPVGARYRFEAPAELCNGMRAFGAPYLPVGATTVWELEVVSAKDVLPKFVAPDPGKQITTASGLKYEVLTEGTGAPATMNEPVQVHYVGWFPDGTLFDSSLLRGEPLKFLVSPRANLIAGWIEGVQLMKEGAKLRFQIPPSLAYGADGKPPTIPPNATLIFQLELVKVGR